MLRICQVQCKRKKLGNCFTQKLPKGNRLKTFTSGWTLQLPIKKKNGFPVYFDENRTKRKIISKILPPQQKFIQIKK